VNRSISSWDAVYKMINTEGATLSEISFSSATGFIFKLTIPPESHEFTDIAGAPIYSIVFKIVITTSSKERLPKLQINSEEINKLKY